MVFHGVTVQANGQAVGLMSVSTVVDVNMLSSAYQLEVYRDLKQPSKEGHEPHSTLTNGEVDSSTCTRHRES